MKLKLNGSPFLPVIVWQMSHDTPSLARDPSYLPAIWFLANIRFEGLNDPVGAQESLERLMAADDVPDDIREAAEAMLEEVRSGS